MTQLEGLQSRVEQRRGKRDGDRPSAAAGWRLRDHHIASRRHQRALDAMTAQHGLGLVRGVALRDAAEVEQHAGFGQARGASAGIQLELRVAHQRPRAGEGSAVRHLRGPARPPPEAHDGADGGVESASTPASPFLGGGEHAEEVGSDGNGRTAGAAAQRHQLAVGTVVAEDLVQGDARAKAASAACRASSAPRAYSTRRNVVPMWGSANSCRARASARARSGASSRSATTTKRRHRGTEDTENGQRI